MSGDPQDHPLSPASDGRSPTGAPSGEPALDVRVRHTRNRLREAVLRLASEQPVENIAVADLVREAGVNRTTFYKHAGSPAAVLEQVLYEELDGVRAVWISDVLAAELPVHEIWERASGALLDHLEHHDALYTVGLVGHRSAALHHLLVEHFTASVSTLLERSPEAVPGQEGPLAWRVEATSRFMAHGEVGIVEAWLSLPAPRERRLFVSAATALLPSWLIPRPR
ncbi:TetR/AcrR family transcriptional regulator [Streptomyces sp. NPDC059651]|uniref:TetR/AcrR family transcriptional regulator n=1 Tax=Streptomyces sp. NPDC059651 TaxID=3346897 RepID=UPI0036B5C861